MYKHLPLLSLILIIFASSCSSSRRSYTSVRYPKAQKERRTIVRDRHEQQLRDEILISAIKYVGRTYKYGGKKPETGFDCSGFVSYVFNENGIPVTGNSRHQATLGESKSKSQLEPGDLVFFGSGDKVSHVAVVLKNNGKDLEVVHATSSRGVRIDEINHSRYWRKRFLFGRDILREDATYGMK